MPRMNALGDVCAGVGIASVNGIAVAQLANWVRWYDNDTIVYQCYEGFARVQFYNKTNGSKLDAEASAIYFIGGGGSEYIARGPDTLFGTIPNLPVHGGPGDMGFDGYCLVKESYQDDLPGKRVILIGPEGIPSGYNTNGTIGWCCRNKDEFAWREDGTGKWLGPSGPIDTWGAADLRLGWGYALYNGDRGLMFHAINNKSVGYILSNTGATFNPDYIIKNNSLLYTYAENAQESPESIRVASVSLNTPMVPLGPPQVPSLNNPVVTITDEVNYPGKEGLKNGQVISWIDDKNPTLGYGGNILIRDGSIYVEVFNKIGKASTGKFRPVKLS